MGQIAIEWIYLPLGCMRASIEVGKGELRWGNTWRVEVGKQMES